MVRLMNIVSRVNPFYSIVTLSIPLLISMFFGISSRRAIKTFLAWLTLIFLFLAIFINVYGFRVGGNFSSQLFSFSIFHVVGISIVLFSALNILLFLYILHREDEHFIKILILFLLSVCLCILVLISRNFLMVFVSLAVFLVLVFQLVASLNIVDIVDNSRDNRKVAGVKDTKDREKSGQMYDNRYIIRLFLNPFLAVILFFFSFSMIYSSTDFKNFTQIVEADLVLLPFILGGVAILAIGVYVYLFLIPFQGSYLKFMRRCESSSFSIMYFLYPLAGIFMLTKLNEVIYYIAERYRSIAGYIFVFLCFICFVSSNLGALKSKSLRRFLSFMLLFTIGLFLLNYAMFSFGFIERDRVEWLIVANLFTLVTNFFPIWGLLFFMEKHLGSDAIANLNSFLRRNIYLGVNAVIILLSLCGLAGTSGYLVRYYYIEPLVYRLSEASSGFGAITLLVMVLVISSFGLLVVNIFRIIVSLFKHPDKEDREEGIGTGFLIPRFYYVYMTLFTLIILFVGVIGLLETLGMSIPGLGLRLTEASVFLTGK